MADELLFRIASELKAQGFNEAAAAVRKIDDDQKKAAKSAKGWKDQTTNVKMAWQGLIGLGIVAFFKSTIDEAAKMERSQFLLGQRVENTGRKWIEAKDNVTAFNQAMSQMAGVAEDEVNDALSRLIDSTGDVGRAQELLGASLGFARAKGISYAQAAEQIGRASLGVTEFTKTMAEQIGITGEKAKDSEFVLATLQERFGSLAQEEDTAQKRFAQFGNELNKVKEEIGKGVMPAVILFIGWLRRLGRAGSAAIDIMNVAFASLVVGAQGTFEAIKNFAQGNFKAASLAVKNMGTALRELEMDGMKAKKALKDAFTEPLDAIKKLPPALEQGTKELKELTPQFKKMLAELRFAQADSDAERLVQLNEALEQEKAIRAEAIAARMGAEGFAIEQIEAMVKQSNAAIDAEQDRNNKAAIAKRVQFSLQAGQIIGVATAKALQGNVNAWKEASIQIIDMIAAQAQAAIVANAITGASKEVATKGIAGIATGAAAIAWGVAQAAVVAGLAQAAKGAIGGGGAGAAPAAGGAAGAGPAAQPAAQAVAPAGREAQTIIIQVSGDMIGDDEFIDKLGQRISQRVENNDLRVVASQTVGS